MDCASCAKTIEKGVRDLDGIGEVRVNYTTETLEGSGEVSAAQLRERVEALGYRLVDEAAAPAPSPVAPTGLRGFLRFLWGQPSLRLAAVLAVAALASVPLGLSGDADLTAVSDVVRWAVIALVGYPIARRGVGSLIYARRITIDLLMTAAAVGAVAIGESGEAVTVVLLFTLGEALESYSAARSRASLGGLLSLRPAEATVVSEHTEDDDVHRHYVVRPVTELVPGQRVLVKPGERIPVDGVIVQGASAVDKSAITGESVPVPSAAGDDVFAGTINGDGTLELEVTRRAEDFTISQIASLVEQAQAQRSPAERFVDRFAQWYTPAVVGLAAAVAVVPPLALGEPLLTPEGGPQGWLYRGLALLIIACPCALIISIPVTVVSALTRLANLGVLVKGGARLDELARTRVFAFDKTGTLTRGRPVVSGVRSLECAHADAHLDDCRPCDDIVALAASVERGSAHPFAHAVLEAATERQVEHRYAHATDITSHAGRGVSGTLNGRRVTVGNAALFEPSSAAHAFAAENGARSSSVMLVGEGDAVRGYIEVEDRLRPTTGEALRELKRIDDDYQLVMLTGDRRAVAEALARELDGVDEIRAELLPEQKLEAVRELQARHGTVAMIGDGINDTPALAAARLGVAMGGAGAHQAMEVADVVLMQDDLSRLPQAVRISRRTQRLIRQNIALSLGLKLAFLALVVPGLATLWMAVVADVGATILVTLNGMRMLRAR
ncbi:MAG: cadmium-translocating P-type ATPase [Gammaproteobacteria bacterium]|nr:cadmium-translocating P-type ATPase [Gammaproteobacteria bacterium]